MLPKLEILSILNEQLERLIQTQENLQHDENRIYWQGRIDELRSTIKETVCSTRIMKEYIAIVGLCFVIWLLLILGFIKLG